MGCWRCCRAEKNGSPQREPPYLLYPARLSDQSRLFFAPIRPPLLPTYPNAAILGTMPPYARRWADQQGKGVFAQPRESQIKPTAQIKQQLIMCRAVLY